MTRYTLYLSDPQILKLKKKSKKTGLTVSELMRRALDQFLNTNSKTDDKNITK